jgi:catechol 2,3-dioxygenase-like lactoylglutathione lyase family enzyme
MSEKLTCGISHVGLAVSDLEASCSFFQALGFQKAGGVESYPSYFLSDGDSIVTLWKTKAGDDTNPFDRTKNAGLHHLAIKVSSMDALTKAFEVVSAIEGVQVEFGPEKLTGTPWMHAMVYEPSGCRIELTYHPE